MALPTDIAPEEQEIIDHLGKAIRDIEKAEINATEARDRRDRYIAELRLAGWSLRLIAELTGYSSAQIKNISDAQGLVSTRGTIRK
jgi:hypothetical protein